jgi:hypothetical protein
MCAARASAAYQTGGSGMISNAEESGGEATMMKKTSSMAPASTVGRQSPLSSSPPINQAMGGLANTNAVFVTRWRGLAERRGVGQVSPFACTCTSRRVAPTWLHRGEQSSIPNKACTGEIRHTSSIRECRSWYHDGYRLQFEKYDGRGRQRIRVLIEHSESNDVRLLAKEKTEGSNPFTRSENPL